jgi:flagellin-like protein
MKIGQLVDDDDAVSPVIGVILMVAITVILAAVIATFVLGLGERVSPTAPQASFTLDYEEVNQGDDFGETADPSASPPQGILTITHAGGDSISADNLRIAGSDVTGDTVAWGGGSDTPFGAGSQIQAGDSAAIAIENDDTVRLVFVSDTGQDSATLREYDAPDA